MLLNQYIDHTLLRPEATEEQITKLCQEAIECEFKTVCILSQWLPKAILLLEKSQVLPITVISFPAGELPTDKKVDEAKRAIDRGAREVDMVMNRTFLKEKKWREFFQDIRQVVESVKVPVKVILETSELKDNEKIMACSIAASAGAQFVKTSTGFSKSGATESDVLLMRETVGKSLGVKASGGIRTREDALKMIAAGANRLGTSASVQIVRGGLSQSLSTGTY